MKVQLEKTYPLPADADAAWTLLQDIEAVAGCMPGARITERVDDGHYKGTVGVKLGPASMNFRGDVEVREIDPASRTLRLVGHGTDTGGSSGASMDLTARIEDGDANSCRLVGTSEVSMSGKAAAFGGRMINTVADQVLQQFAANFSQRVQALAAPQQASPPPQDGSTEQPESSERSASPQAQPPQAQLNGLALVWAAVREWLRNLFAARRA